MTLHQARDQQFDPMLQISKRALASSGSGIIILDAASPSYPIVFANDAFCRMTGHAIEAVQGHDFSFFLSQHHDQQEIDAVYNSLANANEANLILRKCHQDGAEIWCKLLISPIPDATGKITYFIGVQTDITEHKRDEERLAHQSTHDALTGLPNRNLLKDRLQQAMVQTSRSDDGVALLFLDLDHFKLINDSLGHAAGDRMLLDVAERLRACVREGDTVSRHGGDEFVLVLREIDQSHHVAAICEKIFQTIADPFFIQGHSFHVTCSIGIALYPQDGQDTATLFKYADMALYQAKDQGRNHYQFFSSEMNERMLERVTLDEALRSAIANDELFLHYQPLVSLSTGQLVGLETLVRWQHPKFGMVSPVRFIPVAEESALIASIGEWVLRKACQDMRTWIDNGLTGFQVAVNVSPRQFRDPRLADRIEHVLAEHRIEPCMLSLEITETVLMQNTASSEATLLQLKRLGVDLALDDFGTGYSSLSYLKRFPFDRVKIDRSFVRDITTDADDAAISRAIISMAHSLGIRVVAEGVETEAQCQFLRRHGCDEMQGYYFSRPLPPMEITTLLVEKKHLPENILIPHRSLRTLLLVDADPDILTALQHLLHLDNYQIMTAFSAEEALEVLAQHEVDVMMTGLTLPGMTGIELLSRAMKMHPDVIRMVLSSAVERQHVADDNDRKDLIYKTLIQPWDDQHLRSQLDNAFRHKALADANQRHNLEFHREYKEEIQRLNLQTKALDQTLASANLKLERALDQQQHQATRANTQLDILREMLEHIPLPMIGMDDDGVIVFLNTTAETLFAAEGLTIGQDARALLPAFYDAIDSMEADHTLPVQINCQDYRVTCLRMGEHSLSRGNLLTLVKQEENA